MNLHEAIQAHVEWFIDLGDSLGEGSQPVDAERIRRTDQCCIGRWLDESDVIYGRLPEFMRVREVHANFHACAAEVVRLFNAGNQLDVLQRLTSPAGCGGISDALIEAFADFDQCCRNVGTSSVLNTTCSEGPRFGVM